MRTPLLLAAFALCAGCAYRTPTPHVPPGLPADLAVTQVTVMDPEGDVDPRLGAEIREQTIELLADAVRVGESPRRSAHVRVRVAIEEQRDYLSFLNEDGIGAFIVVWPVLGGMVIDRARLSVDLKIEWAGGTVTGHGEAEKEGSLYAPARRRALAVALARALADASKDGAPRVGGT